MRSATVVEDLAVDDAVLDPVDAQGFGFRRLPADRQRLDDEEIGMARRRIEKETALLIRDCEQIAEQQYGIERSTEVELLDPRAHGLGVPHVLEHFRRLVDGHHRVTEANELSRDPPDAAAQLE